MTGDEISNWFIGMLYIYTYVYPWFYYRDLYTVRVLGTPIYFPTITGWSSWTMTISSGKERILPKLIINQKSVLNHYNR